MLWSLIKVVLFLGIVLGLSYGASLLMEGQGFLLVSFGAYEFELGPLQTVIAALVFLALVWLLLKIISFCIAILRFMSGDETALSRWWGRNQERRGFEALADGMMALASGEGRLAMNKAARAERYLRRPELTNLVTAQAAEMAGDTKKAEETYKKLLADDRTRFVGVRGIMKQKLAEGDTDLALKLAEKAFALKPKHEETQDVLLKLQAGDGDWKGARKTLGAKLRHGSLPRDVYRRRDAVLALSTAKDLLAEGASIEQREAAIEANKLSPDLVPAAVLVADQYIADDKPRLATRVIKKAWAAMQHPDLAAAFARIVPDETPAKRLKRFSALTKANPSNPETKMLLAELNIAAEDFPAARKALGNLAETDPTKRSLTLMAAIERGTGADDSVVKAWLAKALTASPGPQWICDVDGKAYAEWTPVTDGGFDTLSWKTAPTSEVMTENAAGMLPLIIGAPEPEPALDETADDAIELLPAAVDTPTEDAEAAAPANTPDEPTEVDDKSNGAAAS